MARPRFPLLLGLCLPLWLAACGGGAEDPSPATSAPRTSGVVVSQASSLGPAQLGVVVVAGQPLSEAMGEAYVQAHGVPRENLVRIHLPADSDLVGQADFERAKQALDAQLPAAVQATVLAFSQPSRVVGACAMSITSAMTLGYDPAYCGGCSVTRATPYFNSPSRQPQRDFGLRPSMMLWAADLPAAQALIARGVAAQGGRPTGSGWLVRSSDAARSVRWPQMQQAVAHWGQQPGLSLHYLDRSGQPDTAWVEGEQQLLFYFTGRASVPGLATLGFLPGAVADHLTSYGGVLPAANGQMPATRWLQAGATGSYGTVEEPCNHREKFPDPDVLMAHYLAGERLVEAYWKSVRWPGQGLFLGDPLAAPWMP